MNYYPIEKTLTIKILAIFEMNVGSGEWSFNYLLDAIRNWRGFGYRFEVREHIHEENSITEALVADADELWFFGTALCEETKNSRPLNKMEIAAVKARMDAGVGVFATGDHDAIGSCLCEQIPRVDKMRIWRGKKASESYNSSVRSPYRDVMDYERAAKYGEIETDDRDTSAKQIWATTIDDDVSARELFQLGYMGKEKHWIRFLPDHAHEGQLYDFTVDDPKIFTAVYPGAPLPRVVAYANRAAADEEDAAGFVKYPVVSVYESKSKEGNIVVDSTFHHWTDSNALRLRFSPTWLHVEQYAINVANWLLGKRGREKVKNAVEQYIAEIEGNGKELLSAVKKGDKAKARELLEMSGRRLGEHRIVVDTLDRILFDGALKVIAKADEKDLAQLISQRWTLPEGFDAKILRDEGKLETVLIGLTFAEKSAVE